jgi:hypothetical protein
MDKHSANLRVNGKWVRNCKNFYTIATLEMLRWLESYLKKLFSLLIFLIEFFKSIFNDC